ncbi:protein-L-isoaspartate O-methyltransferase [Xanthomonadaceae bacterium JHOS43]|nr:protein-L-isoaspartate O-methyltransferase [Xanthomonadaceae bacterium JHOS43]MCX7562135.1 protein-L-isoaspartate O-methyltransferase [Xanthomonadaceae bacterium XH05]
MSLDFEQARSFMVNQQVRPWDVIDPRVLEALGSVRREDFVPARYRRMAFTDMALPLEHGETMMKPVIEGRLLQALELRPEDEVLEIGTGSGFLTACLAQLARDVVSIDIHADFVERARTRLETTGLTNIRVELADALNFHPDRRFDAVAVTGAVAALPAEFLAWLKPGGRLFAVRGHSPVQQAVLYRTDAHGRVGEEGLFETDLPYLIGAEPVAQFAL